MTELKKLSYVGQRKPIGQIQETLRQHTSVQIYDEQLVNNENEYTK